MTSPLRVARVANLVREIISTTLLRQVKDPALGELSVTEVELSSDLRVAKVFFYLHNDSPARRREVKEALERAKGFLRRQLGGGLRLRVTPELRFLFDDSIERGAEIDALFAKIKEEDEARAEENAAREARLSGQEEVTSSSEEPH